MFGGLAKWRASNGCYSICTREWQIWSRGPGTQNWLPPSSFHQEKTPHVPAGLWSWSVDRPGHRWEGLTWGFLSCFHLVLWMRTTPPGCVFQQFSETLCRWSEWNQQLYKNESNRTSLRLFRRVNCWLPQSLILWCWYLISFFKWDLLTYWKITVEF